jgi:hypothetical protein
MMTSIKTKINGLVNIDLNHGFDCVVKNQIVQNFRSYEAARAYQRAHNANMDRILKDNIGVPKNQRKPVPTPCSIIYYTA